MHADGEDRRGTPGDRAVKHVDVERDELIGIVAFALRQRADVVVAQERQGDLVELQVTAAGGIELFDFLLKHCDHVVPIGFDIGIDRAIDGILELAEVHVRWRRHRHLHAEFFATD